MRLRGLILIHIDSNLRTTTAKDIAHAFRITENHARSQLYYLCRDGKIIRKSHGHYQSIGE